MAAQKKFRAERDVVYFPKPAESLVTARKHTFFRPDKFNATGLQFFDVLLCGVMLPHFSVHGWRDQNGRARSEGDRGERMTSQPVREFGDNVCRGGRDQEQVRAIRQINVTGPPVLLFIVEA